MKSFNKGFIVESLSKKKFFLINNKGKIKYEKAFSMIIIGDYLKFKFNSYLIGRVYDMRKNFFEDIETMYEAIFFELLFKKTKKAYTPSIHRPDGRLLKSYTPCGYLHFRQLYKMC